MANAYAAALKKQGLSAPAKAGGARKQRAAKHGFTQHGSAFLPPPRPKGATRRKAAAPKHASLPKPVSASAYKKTPAPPSKPKQLAAPKFSQKLSTGQRFGKVAPSKKPKGKVQPGTTSKAVRKFSSSKPGKPTIMQRVKAIATYDVGKAARNLIDKAKSITRPQQTGKRGGKFVVGSSGKKLYLGGKKSKVRKGRKF